MSAVDSVREWTRGLKDLLGAAVHGHVAKALAALSFAMSLARSCQSLAVGCCLPGAAACPASVRRRLERLLANDRLDVTAVYARLCAALAERRRGRHLVLIVDETDRDDGLRSLRVLAACKRRCLPLLGLAYRPDDPPGRMGELLVEQLALVHGWLDGYGLRVTLLADRGLAWPSLVRLCRRLGWHHVLRLQAQTKLRDRAGRRGERAVRDLLRGGRRFARADGVEVFKKAGWVGGCCVTAVRERGCRSPWYLLSDGPSGYARVRRYCQRMWCEQSFRDEKSGGLRWRESRVHDPAHATRLLLLIALAVWLCMLVGLAVVRRGWRRRLDCHRRRMLSYFKIGLLWLHATLARPDQPACPPSLESL